MCYNISSCILSQSVTTTFNASWSSIESERTTAEGRWEVVSLEAASADGRCGAADVAGVLSDIISTEEKNKYYTFTCVFLAEMLPFCLNSI